MSAPAPIIRKVKKADPCDPELLAAVRKAIDEATGRELARRLKRR
jgi:hypothetical protein